MKYAQQEAFLKHLESAAPADLSPVYLIISTEDYEREKALALILKMAGGQEQASTLHFEGSKLDGTKLLQELNTLSMFGQDSLYIIHQCEALDKGTMAMLSDYLERPNPQARLILLAEKLAANTRLYKRAERAGVLLHIPEQKRWEKQKLIGSWIQSLFKEEGVTIDPQAAALMAGRLGTDKTLLAGEVEKLICYVGDRKKVGVQDVSELCATSNQETIWQLGEYVLQRQVGAALRALRALMAESASLVGLIVQLRTSMQNAFELCSMVHSGTAQSAMAGRFPYLTPKLLEKNQKLALSYGPHAFRKALLLLNDVELKAKSAGNDPEILAETLITKLASL